MDIIYIIIAWLWIGFIFGVFAMKSSKQEFELKEGVPMVGLFMLFGGLFVVVLPFLLIAKIAGVKFK